MLQHRHDWLDHATPGSKWFHDVNMVHTKYPHAHDKILEEREHTPTPRGPRKPAAPTLSFNEFGEPLTPEDVDTNLARYRNPPEYGITYAEEAALAEVNEILAAKPARK